LSSLFLGITPLAILFCQSFYIPNDASQANQKSEVNDKRQRG